MKLIQERFTHRTGWETLNDQLDSATPDILFVFGETELLGTVRTLDPIRKKYPDVPMFGCTTSGEIAGTDVHDDAVIVTGVAFDSTPIAIHSTDIEEMEDSYAAGQRLADMADHNDLKHVLVMSDGLKVNGTELVNGLSDKLPDNVAITGGLAGDQDRFQTTYVVVNDEAAEGKVAICCLYGDTIQIGYGSVGGWDSFGADRLVTKVDKNILYELDGKPALDLYKEYLGGQASELPAAGLLFPLSIRQDDDEDLVRTILSVDEETKSMIFAGDIPEGSTVRLMKANFERLIDGAAEAAEESNRGLQNFEPELALLISCVGRKLVLKQRTEEELESVKQVFGGEPVMAGFYSYGEICPTAPTSNQCQLHNQTMTITLFTEQSS